MAKLVGQVAIISGGLGDIGRAIALELAHHGASVAVGDVLPAKAAKNLVAEIQRLGVGCRYDRVDVSDSAAVDRWLQTVEKQLGVATLIVPNAAIATVTGLRTLTPRQWRREMSINLDGAFYLANAAALRLVKRKRPGRIVFIGSWAAAAPHVHIPTYSVAKAGLRMLCQVMAREFAADDILINELAPGYVNAGLSGRMMAKDPARKRRAINRVPIHRLISTEEVAREAAHLCDPLNRHMTGSVVLMDGGLSLR